MSEISFDVVIVGAGVIGLSIARSLSDQGLSTVVLEKNSRSGDEISSRNSGVIHAGMYYEPDSLKSEFCIEGNRRLYEYCIQKKIKFEKTGKLIISSNAEEHNKLIKIFDRGIKKNINLEQISAFEAQEIEPEITCYSAILSPNTGLIDVSEFIQSLEYDIQTKGGIISHNSEFIEAKKDKDKFKIKVESSDSFEISSNFLINCSGLSSAKVSAKVEGLKKNKIKEVFYGKGHYFKYQGKNPFKTLIYPVPGPFSLGVHLSWDFSRQLKFGPDLVWADKIDYKFSENIKENFVNSIKCYWKEIEEEKLMPDYVGIRPKIHSRNEVQKDFYISQFEDHGIGKFYNLQGIESPGLTSSLAISSFISKEVSKELN
jgi:L-2-hydroxyglutarate oxidase LhgO